MKLHWLSALFICGAICAQDGKKNGENGDKSHVDQPVATHAEAQIPKWADVQLRDPVTLGPWTPKDIFKKGAAGLVIVPINTGCPKTRHRLQEIKDFVNEFGPQGIQVVAVDGDEYDDSLRVARWVQEMDINFPVLLDPKHEWIKGIPLKRTNQFVLLDPDFKILYKGDISNGYTPHGPKERTEEYLKKAATALVEAEPDPVTKKRNPKIEVSTTGTDGCALEYFPPEKMNSAEAPKFCESNGKYPSVASVIYSRCAICHIKNGGAPSYIQFDSYESIRSWGEMIKEVVSERRMPPWSADPHVKPPGGFKGDRSLSELELNTIVKWIDGNMQKGSEEKCPTAPKAKDLDGWEIDKPDLIIDTGNAFQVPASVDEEVDYQYFEVPVKQLPKQTITIKLPEKYKNGAWVSQSEIRPGNKEIVHHAIAHIGKEYKEDEQDDRPGIGRKAGKGLALWHMMPVDERPPLFSSEFFDWVKKMKRLNDLYDPKVASILGSYVPGEGVRRFDDGSAIFLPKDAVITFEMHYTTNGVESKDETPARGSNPAHTTQIGLKFTDKPVRAVRTNPMAIWPLAIPEGEPNYELVSKFTFDKDSRINFLQPHMHKLGKSVKYEIVRPDGSKTTLLSIPRWDFRWQTEYRFNEPYKVPAGSKLIVTAKFDNSIMNPNQSNNPPKSVEWGFSTKKEMMNPWLGYTLEEDVSQEKDEPTPSKPADEDEDHK